jgi:hypothetical protein
MESVRTIRRRLSKFQKLILEELNKNPKIKYDLLKRRVDKRENNSLVWDNKKREVENWGRRERFNSRFNHSLKNLQEKGYLTIFDKIEYETIKHKIKMVDFKK